LVILFLFFFKQYNQFLFHKVKHQTNGAAFYLVLDAHIKLPTTLKDQFFKIKKKRVDDQKQKNKRQS